jgi:hypothetical protein
VSRKRKAKRQLERSRRKGALKAELRLNQAEQDLARREIQLHAKGYEDAMVEMYRTADPAQRKVLEAEYKKVVGVDLKSVQEARIIASLQSQPRGVCDL